MYIKHTNKTITERGNTADIIKVVMYAYDVENDVQIEELAQELKGDNDTDTCRNIWNYLLDNVRYKADVGKQEVRTPARLVHDGTGDCKSYSLFAATVLRYLMIPHFFRFVSYDDRKEATHVYVVAKINGSELPIDAVAKIQAGTDFGNELKYNYKCDMKNRTTKIAYLAGVNDRFAIGNVTDNIQDFFNSEAFDVFLDRENENNLTLAKGYLLSEWDKEWANFAFADSDSEKIERLNRLQYIALMIALYNEYHDDNAMLYKAGVAIGELLRSGALKSDTTNPDDRDFFDENSLYRAKELMSDNDELPINEKFIEVWRNSVLDLNYNSEDEAGIPMSIGQINSLRSNLTKSGAFYLYTFINDSEAQNISSKVYQKRLTQIRQDANTQDAIKSQISYAEQRNRFEQGCIVSLGGSPRKVIENYASGKAEIGAIPWALIITSAISLIISIVKWFKKKPLPEEQLKKAGASKSDFPAMQGKMPRSTNSPKLLAPDGFLSTAGGSWLLPVALLGGAFLFKKSKQKK